LSAAALSPAELLVAETLAAAAQQQRCQLNSLQVKPLMPAERQRAHRERMPLKPLMPAAMVGVPDEAPLSLKPEMMVATEVVVWEPPELAELAEVALLQPPELAAAVEVSDSGAMDSGAMAHARDLCCDSVAERMMPSSNSPDWTMPRSRLCCCSNSPDWTMLPHGRRSWVPIDWD